MYKTTTLPKNAFKCRHSLEFFRIKKGAKLFIEDNIELRKGMEYYVYSEKEKGYYKRTVEGMIDYMKYYFYEIIQGDLMLVYTLDEANEIKEYMKRNNIESYNMLIRKMIGDYGKDKLKGKKRYTDDWETKYKKYDSYQRS
jgi:hypothetical protein